MRRYEISDENGLRIEHMLPGKQGNPGGTAQDNRLFINAGLGIARTGTPGPICPNASASITPFINAFVSSPTVASPRAMTRRRAATCRSSISH